MNLIGILLPVDEAEGISKFLSDTTAQWKNLALEVRSVRSMLEEVISNWEKYTSSVAALQAWLEDAERMLSQSENAKRVRTIARMQADNRKSASDLDQDSFEAVCFVCCPSF